jgi:hypothetical protein
MWYGMSYYELAEYCLKLENELCLLKASMESANVSEIVQKNVTYVYKSYGSSPVNCLPQKFRSY